MKTCPEPALCQAGAQCAGRCSTPQTYQLRLVPAGYGLSQSMNSPHLGCYPGCFYYGDSCYRKDCKKGLATPLNPT